MPPTKCIVARKWRSGCCCFALQIFFLCGVFFEFARVLPVVRVRLSLFVWLLLLLFMHKNDDKLLFGCKVLLYDKTFHRKCMGIWYMARLSRHQQPELFGYGHLNIYDICVAEIKGIEFWGLSGKVRQLHGPVSISYLHPLLVRFTLRGRTSKLVRFSSRLHIHAYPYRECLFQST